MVKLLILHISYISYPSPFPGRGGPGNEAKVIPSTLYILACYGCMKSFLRVVIECFEESKSIVMLVVLWLQSLANEHGNEQV